MSYVHVVEARVGIGMMEQFTRALQQWERRALGHPDGPDHHSVLVDRDDPRRITVLSHFADEEQAHSFDQGELFADLRSGIEGCCEAAVDTRRMDVFYAVGRGGAETIFGETPGPS